jgi:hypothetical protein
MYDCRCDERLKPKDDESTFLTYTGLIEELEYLKIKTRLIDDKFASVMGECVIKSHTHPSHSQTTGSCGNKRVPLACPEL